MFANGVSLALAAAVVLAACGAPRDGRSGAGDRSEPPSTAAGGTPGASEAGSEPAEAAGGLVLEVDPPSAAPGERVELVMRHADGRGFEYGAAYSLQRRAGSGWEPYDECEGQCAWPLWLAIVQPGQEARQAIVVPREPGLYRITKPTEDAGAATAELRVTADG